MIQPAQLRALPVCRVTQKNQAISDFESKRCHGRSTSACTFVSVQVPTYADNMALPAFARRTLLVSAGHTAIDQYFLPAGPTAAIKPETAGLLLWANAGRHRDWRTDTVPLHRPCSAYEYYAGSANKVTNTDSVTIALLNTAVVR